MPHTGIEEKTPWRNVPAAVKEETAHLLGSPVARATRAWGGYAPTPTYRLRLSDGRRAFIKGVNAESNDFMRAALDSELRIYSELPHVIEGHAPAFLGSFKYDDWSLLLLEDVGPKTAPPWTASLTRAVVGELAAFHESTVRHSLPEWMPTPGLVASSERRTRRCVFGLEDLAACAFLAGPKAGEAEQWIKVHGSILAQAPARLPNESFNRTLIHGDIRTDNLRLVDGRLVMFDWPQASNFPPEFDLAAFAQAVTAEGGPEPQVIVNWYGERGAINQDALDAAVASVAGYFANAAWRPAILELPRMRTFQREQLKVTLTWAAHRFRLPEPTWVSEIQTRPKT
jgi:hypothetical protein